MPRKTSSMKSSLPNQGNTFDALQETTSVTQETTTVTQEPTTTVTQEPTTSVTQEPTTTVTQEPTTTTSNPEWETVSARTAPSPTRITPPLFSSEELASLTAPKYSKEELEARFEKGVTFALVHWSDVLKQNRESILNAFKKSKSNKKRAKAFSFESVSGHYTRELASELENGFFAEIAMFKIFRHSDFSERLLELLGLDSNKFYFWNYSELVSVKDGVSIYKNDVSLCMKTA